MLFSSGAGFIQTALPTISQKQVGESNANFCTGTQLHSYSFIPAFFLSLHETLGAVTAHRLLDSFNDNIQQKRIICLHLYSSKHFLQTSAF